MAQMEEQEGRAVLTTVGQNVTLQPFFLSFLEMVLFDESRSTALSSEACDLQVVLNTFDGIL